VNQKHRDAAGMLRLLRQRLAQGLKPKIVAYSFEHTSTWEAAWRQSGELRFDSNAEASVITLEPLLDELRLEGDHYRQHSLMALERFFAIREAERLGMTVSDEHTRKTEIAFSRERSLQGAGEVERWMTDNNLNNHQFAALMMDETRVRWVHQRAHFASVSCLPEQLRLSGDYPRLLARALAKARLLESFGLRNPCLEDAGLTESQLLRWYFEELLRQPVPGDLNTYALDVGFASLDAFCRALLKE